MSEPNNFAEFLADLGGKPRSEIVQLGWTSSTPTKSKEDNLSLGERLYCVIQDVEEYIQHNNLEQDEELDFILKQLETIKEKIDGANI